MAVEVWYAYVNRYLEPVLAACREVYQAELRAGTHWYPVPGALEWTLPFGMDDGNGLVRLTVVSEYVPERSETWARVAVAAGTAAFMGLGTGDVALPRYTDGGGEIRGVREPAAPPGSAPRPDARLTRGMAEALLEGVGGVPGSLREEPGGEYSFGVSMKPE
ncbi:hypothetical protein AB0B21_06755 [Streptomyces rimosus]|uniref:hypothetical protein n=1 Tax=Streptomyces rimosus TaxID=1927 RepID=UPI000519329B|nr:hypothetical protein [Streptomyces rimosus]